MEKIEEKKKVGRPKKTEEQKKKDAEHIQERKKKRAENRKSVKAIDTTKKRKATQPAFTDVNQLEKAINRYFDKCTNNYRIEIDAEGNEIRIQEPLPFTMAGLARSLGISRATLLNYKHQSSDFCAVVEEAKLRIEEYAETQLYVNRNATGIIFNLKNNFNWKDKQEVEANVENKIKIIPPKFD